MKSKTSSQNWGIFHMKTVLYWTSAMKNQHLDLTLRSLLQMARCPSRNFRRVNWKISSQRAPPPSTLALALLAPATWVRWLWLGGYFLFGCLKGQHGTRGIMMNNLFFCDNEVMTNIGMVIGALSAHQVDSTHQRILDLMVRSEAMQRQRESGNIRNVAQWHWVNITYSGSCQGIGILNWYGYGISTVYVLYISVHIYGQCMVYVWNKNCQKMCANLLKHVRSILGFDSQSKPKSIFELMCFKLHSPGVSLAIWKCHQVYDIDLKN